VPKSKQSVSLDSLRLERESGVPFHIQIEEMLRSLIKISNLTAGSRFPDELTLANRLGVSRGTVRTSIMKLVREGILERRPGIGTKIADKAVESGIVAWRSFSREMERKGIKVQLQHCHVGTAPAGTVAAAALQIKAGVSVLRLDRARGWNDEPVQFSRTWFHPRLNLTGAENFELPLYEMLKEKTGVDADQAHEEFLAVGADAEMVQWLKVKRERPLLLRRQTTYDSGARPIDYTEIHYRSDNFTLTLDLRRGTS
jgi:GntR family transcriptional regulator